MASWGRRESLPQAPSLLDDDAAVTRRPKQPQCEGVGTDLGGMEDANGGICGRTEVRFWQRRLLKIGGVWQACETIAE